MKGLLFYLYNRFARFIPVSIEGHSIVSITVSDESEELDEPLSELFLEGIAI